MPLLGQDVQGAVNYLSRETVEVGVVAARVLEDNAKRAAYRIFADPDNVDNIYLAYDANLTVLNTFNIIGPGEMFEDSGWLECFKGPVYLISGNAAQVAITEEVVLKDLPRRGRR